MKSKVHLQTYWFFNMPFNVFFEKLYGEGVIDLSLLGDDEKAVLEPFSFWLAVSKKIPEKIPLLMLKTDEAKNELGEEDFFRYGVFECEVVSCKPRFVKLKDIMHVRREFHGVLRLNGDRFNFVSPRRIEAGRCYVAAKPLVDERKKVVFEVLHARRLDQLASVAPLEVRSLDDIRGVYPQLVGEDVNVFLAVLSLASRLNLDKDFWVMGIVVQGLSSAGKSYFMKNILRPWAVLGRVEEFTRLTGAYLERKFADKNVDNMVFAIYELGEDTPQQLHLTLSEGRLRVGLVDRETGEASEFTFEGLPFLFSTTPVESLRTDIRNRVIVTSIDESDEQTRRVIEYETRRAADPAYASMVDKQAEDMARRFAKYLSTLRPCRVKVPFADKLLQRLKFSNVKLRRDWRKLLSLLQASAIVFQSRRPAEEVAGELVVTATVEDLRNILHVMPAFRQTLQNVTEQQRRVLDVMAKGQEYTTSMITHACWERGWRVSAKRIRDVLQELEQLGYVIIRRDLGRENKYEKLADAEAIDFADVVEELGEGPGVGNGVEGVGSDLEVPGSMASGREISENQEGGNLEAEKPMDVGMDYKKFSLNCIYGNHGDCGGEFETLVKHYNRFEKQKARCECECHMEDKGVMR